MDLQKIKNAANKALMASDSQYHSWSTAEQELVKAKCWLQAAHQDIMQNFDPDVIKFKRKRKIVIAPGAFDGLRGDDGDE